MHVPQRLWLGTGIFLAGAAVACSDADRMTEPAGGSFASSSPTTGQFQFAPLPASAACTIGGNAAQPFAVPAGYSQTIVASQAQVPSSENWDMNTQNETGP